MGVFIDKRQAATRLPNFFVYFILTLNFGATTISRRNCTCTCTIVPVQFHAISKNCSTQTSKFFVASIAGQYGSRFAAYSVSVNAPQVQSVFIAFRLSYRRTCQV